MMLLNLERMFIKFGTQTGRNACMILRINKIAKMHEYIYFWRFAKNL